MLFYTTENHGWSDTLADVTSAVIFVLFPREARPQTSESNLMSSGVRQMLKVVFQQYWDQSTVLIEVMLWQSWSSSRGSADLPLPALLASLCSLEGSFHVEYTPLLL